jgi:hypothetical protein
MCGATAEVFARPRPICDVGRIEIPQCSSLLPCRGVLSPRISPRRDGAADLAMVSGADADATAEFAADFEIGSS